MRHPRQAGHDQCVFILLCGEGEGGGVPVLALSSHPQTSSLTPSLSPPSFPQCPRTCSWPAAFGGPSMAWHRTEGEGRALPAPSLSPCPPPPLPPLPLCPVFPPLSAFFTPFRFSVSVYKSPFFVCQGTRPGVCACACVCLLTVRSSPGGDTPGWVGFFSFSPSYRHTQLFACILSFTRPHERPLTRPSTRSHKRTLPSCT